jgi:hypothetical protein
MVITEKFYQELGYLFYAVASVDKKVAKEEISELKKCVREEWLKLEDSVDTFGTDAAYQIETVFDWLATNHESTQFAFGTFEEYFQKNKKVFTPEITKMILATSDRIAAAYAAKNKAELTILSQINQLLN